MTWLLGYLIPFAILLGILVTVHELGHFLVAKFFKIKVEKFSIGFGPRIFGKTIGDTEYRVAWIPLGGYVKMAGDDPTDDAARNVPGSFLGAANWKRMLVVLAGPGVNLILPIFVLAVVFFVGKEYPAPWVGTVITNSPAYKAGLQTGDRIEAVDGEPVRKWDEMTSRIRANSEPKTLTVLRDGKKLELVMTPELKTVMDEFGIKKPMPAIGITRAGETAVVRPVPGKPAHQAGIQLGDRIKSIGGKDVTFWIDLDDVIASLPAGKHEVLVERPRKPSRDPAEAGKDATDDVKVALDVPANATLADLGLENGELYIRDVQPETPAAVAKLAVGDRVVSVNGLVLQNGSDLGMLLQEIQERDGDPPPTTWVVEREGQTLELTLQPVAKLERVPGTSRSEKALLIGTEFFGAAAIGPMYVERYTNPFAALAAGVRGTGEVISMNLRAFGKIFGGEIKARDSVGGPIKIAQVAGMAAKAGPSAFIEVLVHMSVILGIMNLLPIPVLDGGHLAFFAMEAVLRRPPSLRFREVAQQAGLLLLLALMAFVLVNDVVTTVW